MFANGGHLSRGCMQSVIQKKKNIAWYTVQCLTLLIVPHQTASLFKCRNMLYFTLQRRLASCVRFKAACLVTESWAFVSIWKATWEKNWRHRGEYTVWITECLVAPMCYYEPHNTWKVEYSQIGPNSSGYKKTVTIVKSPSFRRWSHSLPWQNGTGWHIVTLSAAL